MVVVRIRGVNTKQCLIHNTVLMNLSFSSTGSTPSTVTICRPLGCSYTMHSPHCSQINSFNRQMYSVTSLASGKVCNLDLTCKAFLHLTFAPYLESSWIISCQYFKLLFFNFFWCCMASNLCTFTHAAPLD